jgi:hypothetical protein
LKEAPGRRLIGKRDAGPVRKLDWVGACGARSGRAARELLSEDFVVAGPGRGCVRPPHIDKTHRRANVAL